MNDWTGNKKTTFATLGASSHSETEREKNDFYATSPVAMCTHPIRPVYRL